MKNRRTRKVGSGITAREKLAPVLPNPENNEVIAEGFRARNRALYTPWGANKAIIELTRSRLAQLESELPDREVDYDAYNQHFKEREKLGWYLRMIVINADVAERAIDEGRPWEAIDQALLIGELLTELKMKALWENYALKGQKHQEATDKDAENRRKQPAQVRYARVKMHRLAGHSWENSYRLAAKHFDMSASMIKRDCLPLKKLDNTID